jgi:hypothetical protein
MTMLVCDANNTCKANERNRKEVEGNGRGEKVRRQKVWEWVGKKIILISNF